MSIISGNPCKTCGSRRRYSQSLNCVPCLRAANRKRAKNRDPVYRMVSKARHRAKVRGLPFDITTADISIPEVCPVLGIPLKVAAGQPRDDSPTIDRRVPALGYVRGNVAVISNRANRIKTDATPAELAAVAAWLK